MKNKTEEEEEAEHKMSHEIKLETSHRERIKPSTPTPPHLKTFKLSLLDQISPNINGNTTLFFPSNPSSDSDFFIKSKLLQNSLSQTLTFFYPLAGRLQDASTINCNDEGAFFIESQTHTTLSEILTNPNFDTLECLLPTNDNKTMAISNNSMLLVRFTFFGCGSTAVTISLTHKLVDFATVITFLKTWTATAAVACGGPGGGSCITQPDLTTGATLFPPREIPNMSASVKTSTEKFTSRRFVFNASKLSELKNRVKTTSFEPSRVEVVLALIWKCALSAASKRRRSGTFTPSALFQAVNLRNRMDPVIQETAVGNFVWPFAVTVKEDCHVALDEMVKRMRESMREFIENKVEMFKEEGGFGIVMESLKERGEVMKSGGEIVVYKCSSWCKFPLLEFDFGWGKTVWTCSVNKMVSNTIALMDTRDGGVEAFVTLDEGDIDLFEQNEELLHYAVLNPPILI